MVENLGYDSVCKMYYGLGSSQGFMLIFDDAGIMKMLQDGRDGKRIEVYIQHNVQVDSSEQRVVHEVEAVELENGEDIEIQTNLQSDKVCISDDGESDDEDYIFEDLPELSDNDEELIEARQLVEDRKKRRRLERMKSIWDDGDHEPKVNGDHEGDGVAQNAEGDGVAQNASTGPAAVDGLYADEANNVFNSDDEVDHGDVDVDTDYVDSNDYESTDTDCKYQKFRKEI